MKIHHKPTLLNNFILLFLVINITSSIIAQNTNIMDINTLSKHPIHQTEVNGINYAYIEKGEGPVIVFLHGFPDLANTWDDAIDELSQNYRCIAPFLTGYYPTGIAPDGNYTPKRVAEDIKGLVDKLGIDTFIVIGQDWGASITYSLANLCPDRIPKIVTIAIPHGRFLKPTIKLLFKARHFLALRNEKKSQFAKKNNYAYIDKLYKRWSPNWKEAPETSQQMKQVLAMPGYFESIYGYYWSFNDNRNNKELNRFYAQLPQMPVLVFVGKTDGALVMKPFYKMKERLGDQMTLKMHDVAGHFLHREAPDYFMKHTKEFLED